MIKVEKAKICLTENVLRQLLAIVEQTKNKTSFTNAPMPDGDMSILTATRHKRLRGFFVIESPYSGISFEIAVDSPFRQSESMPYKLKEEEII